MTASDGKDNFNMARIKSIAILVSLGVAAGGCAANQVAAPAEANRGLDSVNQPVVQRTDYVVDLQTSGGRLAPGERDRLHAWLASLDVGYGDKVWVDDTYGGGAAEDVARVAADYGLLLSDGAPVTAGSVQPGSVRVVVSRSSASVPGCPNWEGPGGASATSPNYGCAMNSNLAAMIADPNDLVLGQEGSVVGDATTASKAIRAYRSAVPTGAGGLKDTVTKGGK